jgi:hypothetical protein
MDFQGPTAADYENVRSLNIAFLELLQNRETARRYFEGLSRQLARRLQRLSRREIGWLGGVPFLLFSFRERDDSFWQEVLNDDRSRDLFAVPLNTTEGRGRLVSAGLGFVWQLASRNPFAARLLCGASTHWCEQITEQTFFHLLAVAGHRSDLLVLRAQHDGEFWRKLLDTGLSTEIEIRTAAYISALQYFLTRQPGQATWQAAACASRDPALKVAEEPKP